MMLRFPRPRPSFGRDSAGPMLSTGHSGISMLTPDPVYFGNADQIIAQENAVRDTDRATHPDRLVRWSADAQVTQGGRLDRSSQPIPHHTGDSSLIDPEERLTIVDRFRSELSPIDAPAAFAKPRVRYSWSRTRGEPSCGHPLFRLLQARGPRAVPDLPAGESPHHLRPAALPSAF